VKRINLALTVFMFLAISVSAQTKKDGTPDMRYKANKKTYGNSSSAPNYSSPKPERNYVNGGQYKVQSGYQKSNGTFVTPTSRRHLTTKLTTITNRERTKKLLPTANL
jgi:hypothetical protein